MGWPVTVKDLRSCETSSSMSPSTRGLSGRTPLSGYSGNDERGDVHGEFSQASLLLLSLLPEERDVLRGVMTLPAIKVNKNQLWGFFALLVAIAPDLIQLSVQCPVWLPLHQGSLGVIGSKSIPGASCSLSAGTPRHTCPPPPCPGSQKPTVFPPSVSSICGS